VEDDIPWQMEAKLRVHDASNFHSFDHFAVRRPDHLPHSFRRRAATQDDCRFKVLDPLLELLSTTRGPHTHEPLVIEIAPEYFGPHTLFTQFALQSGDVILERRRLPKVLEQLKEWLLFPHGHRHRRTHIAGHDEDGGESCSFRNNVQVMHVQWHFHPPF